MVFIQTYDADRSKDAVLKRKTERGWCTFILFKNIKRGHPGDETLQYDGDHLTEKTMPDSMKNVTGRFPKNHILKELGDFLVEKDIILEDRSKKFIFIQK